MYTKSKCAKVKRYIQEDLNEIKLNHKLKPNQIKQLKSNIRASKRAIKKHCK